MARHVLTQKEKEYLKKKQNIFRNSSLTLDEHLFAVRFYRELFDKIIYHGVSKKKPLTDDIMK